MPDGSVVLFNGQVSHRGWFKLPGGDMAVYDSTAGGLIDYYHVDHLGSSRLATTPNRAFDYSMAYAPFGEGYAESAQRAGFFTGQFESFAFDIYEFPAREYNDQGRWASPDPAGLSAVDPTDPQSWNRYAYVMNSPMIYLDPSGMDSVPYPSSGPQCRTPAQRASGRCAPTKGFADSCFIDPFACAYNSLDLINFAFTPTGSYTGISCANGECFQQQFNTYDNFTAVFGIGGVGYPINNGANYGTAPFKPTLAYTGSLVWPWYMGMGPAFSASYVPSQNLGCFGWIGAGASVGRSMSAGAVMVDGNRAKEILGGLSFSASYNATPSRGYQGSINDTGSTGGNSFGSTGASASITYSSCWNFCFPYIRKYRGYGGVSYELR